MGIKKFSDYTNESMKKFTDVEKSEKPSKKSQQFAKEVEEDKSQTTAQKGKAPRYKGSASDVYNDEVNREILAQERPKGYADGEIKSKTKKLANEVEDTITPNTVKSRVETDEKDREKVKKENKPERTVANEKKDIKVVGRVAKFPKDVKASTAVSYLENIKVSKGHIWYLLIEKQDNELQMIKYNQKAGVNLSEFVTELKKYYIKKYKNRTDLIEAFEAIQVVGEDKFSVIKNIPNFKIDGKTIISKITEDLTKLLSK